MSGLLCFFVVLVDGKVSEMDVGIFHHHGFEAKLFSTKPGEAFTIDEGLERMKAGNKNIDPHIEFIPLQK